MGAALLRGACTAVGIASVTLGLVGLLVPLFPSFLLFLIAAACFTHGSARLHRWLLALPAIGPLVLEWQRDGVIRPAAKAGTCAGLAVSAVVPALVSWSWLGWVAAAVPLGVGLFVVTRPSAVPARARPPLAVLPPVAKPQRTRDAA